MLRLPLLRRSAPTALATRHRLLTSSATGFYQGKHQFYNLLVKRHGEDYASQKVDTKKLLEAMRQMVSWRSLKASGSNAIEYKNGLRALHLLAGVDGGITKPFLTVGEIEKVLSLENGVTWRMIQETLDYGFPTDLSGLNPQERAVVMFNRVHGIGKIKAQEFVNHGAKTFQDLLGSTEKEFGRRVTDGQKLAMTYHDDMELMIPRSEVEEFKNLIEKALNKADKTLRFEIMGSYRRGNSVSSDIDMVVYHESYPKLDREAKPSRKGPPPGSLMDKVLTALEHAKLLEAGKYFSRGEKKALALTRLPSQTGKNNSHPHRQIDIRLCPLESVPYMLLGNTGDDTLMRILRSKAVAKGWILNEYGMGDREGGVGSVVIRKGTEIIVKSEEEIFEKLGLPYIPPTQRSWHQYRDSFSKYKDQGLLNLDDIPDTPDF